MREMIMIDQCSSSSCLSINCSLLRIVDSYSLSLPLNDSLHCEYSVEKSINQDDAREQPSRCSPRSKKEETTTKKKMRLRMRMRAKMIMEIEHYPKEKDSGGVPSA